MNKYERALKIFSNGSPKFEAVYGGAPITPAPMGEIPSSVSTVAALRDEVNSLIDALTTAGVLIAEVTE